MIVVAMSAGQGQGDVMPRMNEYDRMLHRQFVVRQVASVVCYGMSCLLIFGVTWLICGVAQKAVDQPWQVGVATAMAGAFGAKSLWSLRAGLGRGRYLEAGTSPSDVRREGGS